MFLLRKLRAWSHHKRKHAKALRLLYLLEQIDKSRAYRERSDALQNVSAKSTDITNDLIDLGPDMVWVILKYSRHEGWLYREQIFKVLCALSDDVIGLLIEGIFSPDKEISWSSMKWLRDKADGDPRAVNALVQYIKQPLHEDEWLGAQAVEPLEYWGEIGQDALIEIVLDDIASDKSKETAVLGIYNESLSPEQRERLEGFIKDESQSEEIRETVAYKLRE